MKITHYASNSKENGYHIRTNFDIVIDCGVRGLPCDILLLTHTHGDHFRYFEEYLEKCEVWITDIATYEDVRERISPHKLGMLSCKYGVDGFAPEYAKHYEGVLDCVVSGFPLNHDRACTGFVITHENEKYVHISDTNVFDVPDFVKGADVLTIESNYDEYLLLHSGRHPALIERIAHTHLSNKEAKEIAEQIVKPDGIVAFVHMSHETNFLPLATHTHKTLTARTMYPRGRVVLNE